MKTVGFMAASALAFATGAIAQAPTDDAAKQEKKICKSARVTGSLTRVQRTCLTQSEWDRLAEGTRKNIDDIARDGNQSTIQREIAPLPGGGGW